MVLVRWASLCSLLVMVCPAGAGAGAIRHDRDDALYRALGNEPQYASVGAITWIDGGSTFISSGVLIAPRFVLTAAHSVDSPDLRTFNIGGATWNTGTSYTSADHFAHPNWNDQLNTGWDIGLIRLSAPVTGILSASRYLWEDEVGQVGTSVGFGRTGTGLTGAVDPAGTKRAGQNLIDGFGSVLSVTSGPPQARIQYSDRIIVSDFDHPSDPSLSRPWSLSNEPLDLEYLIAGGDSGGGVFIETGGQHRLAGVHSFGQAIDGTVNASYGDAQGSTRVSQFNEWIDDQITNPWTAAVSGGFAVAGNWAHAAVPDAYDVMGFDLPGAYTVTLDADASTYRMLARAGDVTLDLNDAAWRLISPQHEGSLIVGKYQGNMATVTFANGQLATRDVIIAELPGSTGTMTAGQDLSWTADGSMYVGGNSLRPGGEATLIVADNASVQVVGQAVVWHHGTIDYRSGQLSVNSLELIGGGSVILAPGADKTLRLEQVQVHTAAGSQIDLADNRMEIGSMSLDYVNDLVRTGYNNGNWLGAGISSSIAADDGRLALGIGLLAEDAIAVELTWAGDATLSGQVNIADLSILAGNWLGSDRYWFHGDFNYDGQVNVADLSILAANWQAGVVTPTMSFTDALAMFDAFGDTVVPEPAALSLLGLAAMSLRRRRK